jgi:hypothetical protein
MDLEIYRFSGSPPGRSSGSPSAGRPPPLMARQRTGASKSQTLSGAFVQGHCVVGLLLVTASMRSVERLLARRVVRAMLVSPLLRCYPIEVISRRP